MVSTMSHDAALSHTSGVVVRLGDRGRLVLPADVRRAAGLQVGDELFVTLEDDGLRLTSRRQAALAGRGMFARLAPGRDLVGELLAERRDAARRESGRKAPSPTRKPHSPNQEPRSPTQRPLAQS